MASMILPPSVSDAGLGLRGAQRPRISHVPEYVSTAGVEAVELAARAGLHLDPWEAAILMDSLGERADGKWAAFEVGLVVPRQNGKGAVLEARELAGAILFSEKLLIHSAHEQATSSEHFRRLLGLIEEADFQRRILKVVKGKGSEAIEFEDGTRILFKTRTGGGGRGLTGDFVGLDEAMMLPEATTAALVPTMAARSITGNPQLWYAGSAVDQDKHEHGVVLSRVRERGMKGAARVAYFEFSAPGDDPDALTPEQRSDPEMWAMANPGLGIRISAEHIANECAGALGPREFAVERLGVGDWPSVDGYAEQPIKPDAWVALEDVLSSMAGPVCLSFDVTPNRSAAAVVAAGSRFDGLQHVEVVDHKAGTDWLPERLHGLVATHQVSSVKCAKGSPAESLVPRIRALGVEVEMVSTAEQAQGCGMIFDAVEQKTLRHLGTPELLAAVKGAVKRSAGDAWLWSRKSSAVDISPLVAATNALLGVETASDPAGHVAVFH